MSYIKSFFKNLFGTTASIIPGVTDVSTSMLPTATSSSATETIERGIKDDDTLVGTTLSGTGTSVSSSAMDAFAESNYDVFVAQTYVESMSEDELNDFIDLVEKVQIVEQSKVLQKTYKTQ